VLQEDHGVQKDRHQGVKNGVAQKTTRFFDLGEKGKRLV